MELKSPVKKGFKTPHYRPPLPILYESSSGLCVSEYDWPTFNGLYNGTSVIIDDSRGIFTLTNKGFFGKGSLSKGCPNIGKRKVPSSVIYESQWKRRKQWIESLNIFLKSKSIPDNTFSVVKNNDVNNENVNKNEAHDESNSNNKKLQESTSNENKNNVIVVDSYENEKDREAVPNVESINREPPIIDPDKNQNEICRNDEQKHIVNTTITQLQALKEDLVVTSSEKKTTETENVASKQFDKANIYPKSVKNIRDSYAKEKGVLNANEVLVISDIGIDLEQYFMNLNPRIEEEKIKTVIEVLYLSLEEAFFLSYACNCLHIVDLNSKVLRIKEMWILFQNSQADFIEKYVAYHYFRAKGWVVKAGTKFGGDFLLYKKGPLHFHASYIVIVEVLKNNKNVKNKMTWQKIVGMNRMAESATKEILICHIIRPAVEKEKFNDPSILKEFKVSETLIRRWQATQEKTA